MAIFEFMVIAITISGIALCFSADWRPKRVLNGLGKQGAMWFDHADEQDVENLPSEDAPDAPVAFRPLRSRLR